MLATYLQPQGHVKIFRYITFGPHLPLSIFVDERSVLCCRSAFSRRAGRLGDTDLDSTPPQESIMAYERSDFSIGATDGDAFIDTLREVGNTVLKEVKRDLHDVCRRKINSAVRAR